MCKLTGMVFNTIQHSSPFSFTHWLLHWLMVQHASKNYYYYYNRFTTHCPGLPGWVGTRRINHSGFWWSRHDGVAVALAEPYASYLHFVPEDNHASTSSVRFLWARWPWHPTNSVKALKAIKHASKNSHHYTCIVQPLVLIRQLTMCVRQNYQSY